ncbi:MAG: hypothetical protein IAI49_04790 [Candidatus Eremiobacteraeota bacterium]|nr:hypothetical protein [Candidatus Eremiobacteraeota bacterium]
MTQESRDRANVTAKWMFADYSSSPQGKQLKKTIALEHLAPIPAATAVPVAAPSYPSEFGSNYKSDFNANASQPAPSGHAAGTASPSPVPLPSPSP